MTGKGKAMDDAAALLGCVREYGRYSPTAAFIFLERAREILRAAGVKKPDELFAKLYQRREQCRNPQS